MEGVFSNDCACDKIFTSEFDKENNIDMVLYAYLDTDIAQRLFKYHVGLRFNVTQKYRQQNPLQVPLTLYETPEIAKVFATPANSQLVAFSLNFSHAKKYDDFDLSLKLGLKNANISIDQYKQSALVCREKRKYTNYEYIAYTIKDKNLVEEIQLQDSK